MINDKRIRFNGQQFEVSNEYPNSTRVNFQGQGEVSGRYLKSNGDGNEDLIMTIKPLLVEIVASDTSYAAPKEIGTPVKKSKGQQLRSRIYVLWDQQYKAKYPDFDPYYEAVMDRFISEVEEKLI